jgi:hypothetical protein
MLIKLANTEIRIDGRLLRTARLEADGYQFVDNPDHLLRQLFAAKRRIDLFTFTQRAPESSPKYRYPMEWDNFAAIPISTFQNWWDNQIGFKARNKAKQAEKKGVLLREVQLDDELVKGIHAIYNEHPIRQGRRFRHFGKELQAIHNEESTFADCSAFIGAYFGDRLIGFVKLVWDETRTQAGLMNIISTLGHRDKAPTNALVAHAVRYCADHGIKYLVYSNYEYRRKGQDSVTDFKERNGFQKMDVPRYYVPLTPLGAWAFRLKLHHGVMDFVPEKVLLKVRQWRSSWYAHKLQSAQEVS